MEFDNFYQYFLYTKSWAYVMMLCVLPLYVLYWNTILYPAKKSPAPPPQRGQGETHGGA